VVQEVYSHVIPADDQAAAQLVGDLYRRDVTNLWPARQSRSRKTGSDLVGLGRLELPTP
jgi:hypothetical protein